MTTTLRNKTMIDHSTILPLKNELPSSYAERLGVHYSSQVDGSHKKKNGQYFTPLAIARFMASFCDCKKPTVRILDPGCGTAILACSLAEILISKGKNLSEIQLATYETDKKLIPLAQQSLDYLVKWAAHQKIKLTFVLSNTDFILENTDTLDNQNRRIQYYDLIISNPPYFKLSKSDSRVSAMNSIVHGQPNIYSIFLYLAATLLEKNGRLIFITPRSFASGNYFRLFREKFFSLVQLDAVHLFDSRKEMFQRDEVLQENVVISAHRATSIKKQSKVSLSISHGLKDLDQRQTSEFFLDELLDINSHQRILHLPVSADEEKIIRIFKSWRGNLNSYNIQISTGPVVSFRAKRFIHSHPKEGISLAPLYWLHNTSKMKLKWPMNKVGKGEYIQVSQQSLPLLIPNKNYVFLRRFSSKDDSSRLVATPYFTDSIKAEHIGVENHLNYIYRPNGNLDRNEVFGLTTLLNSHLFDTYFRTFNGNINVSATELREMPLPPIETIRKIGSEVILKNEFSQPIIDEVVKRYFDLNKESNAHA
jgi:adenine-specific DNA-methyltransferase